MKSKSEMAESYVGTPYYMSPELIKGTQCRTYDAVSHQNVNREL